jgi:hypothetical protein
MRRRRRGARRLSVQRADRRHCGRRASPQALLRRDARAYGGAIGRIPAGSPRRDRAGRNRRASAAEAAANLEGRLDDGVAREARPDRFEIRDFAGRAAAGYSVPPRSVRWVRRGHQFYADKLQNAPASLCIAWRERGAYRLDVHFMTTLRIATAGGRRHGRNRPSFLRHPGLAQTDEIRGFE